MIYGQPTINYPPRHVRVGYCEGCGEPVVNFSPGRNRRWCSERCRKHKYDKPCIDCGAPTNGTTPGKSNGRCLRCANALTTAEKRAERDLLDEHLLELRRQGYLNTAIDEMMDFTPHTVANRFSRMRSRGIDVPRAPYWKNTPDD